MESASPKRQSLRAAGLSAGRGIGVNAYAGKSCLPWGSISPVARRGGETQVAVKQASQTPGDSSCCALFALRQSGVCHAAWHSRCAAACWPARKPPVCCSATSAFTAGFPWQAHPESPAHEKGSRRSLFVGAPKPLTRACGTRRYGYRFPPCRLEPRRSARRFRSRWRFWRASRPCLRCRLSRRALSR